MNQMVPRFQNLFTPPPLPLPRERYRPRIGRRAERGDLAELLRTRHHVLAQIGCVDFFESSPPSSTASSPALLEDGSLEDGLPDAGDSLAGSLAQLPLFADDDPEIEVCYLDEIDLQDAPTSRMCRGEVIAIALTEAYQQAREDPDLIFRPDPPKVAPDVALASADPVVELQVVELQAVELQEESADDALELSDDELELSDDELEIQPPESVDDGELEIEEVEVELDFEDLSLIEEALDAAAAAHAAESVERQLSVEPRSSTVDPNSTAREARAQEEAAQETVDQPSAEARPETGGDLSGAIFSALQVAVSRRPDGAIEVRPLAAGQELPEGARLAMLLPRSGDGGAEMLELFGSAG